MLQSIRDRATGPIAWGIVGLIAIPFAFWGIDSYIRGPGNPEVAEVGDVEISQGQLQRAYDQHYQRLQQLMGENFDPDSINNAQLRRGVLENLIREELLSQYVRDEGYRVSDVAIANTLRQQPGFQEDGAFSAERYREVLARSGYTPAAYESRLRNALAVDQVQQGLTGSAFVTPRDVAAAARLEKQRRRIQYLQFDTDRFAAQAEVSEQEIRDFYNDQPLRFSTPERVKLEYLEIDRNTLEPADRPDNAVLEAMYEAEKQSRFTTPEQRRARHILIQTESEADEDALARIQQLADKLKKGADFQALAKTSSDDTGSAEQGGDLGWVGRGVMVPEFEDALYALPQGKVSEPVKTPFGWHLILVDEIRDRQVQPIDSEEVQQSLLTQYREKELAERFQQMSKRLDELTFDNPEGLDVAADELDLEVRESGWIGREGGEGLGQHQMVVEAAFSPVVLNEGENSNLLKLSESRYLVLRIKSHEEARQRPFKEVSGEIEAELRREKGLQRARELARTAMESLRSGQSAEEVAASMGAPLNTPGWVMRDNEELDSNVVRTAFSMPRPSGNASIALAALAEGDQAVVVVSEVEDGDPTSLGDDERQDIARRLAARNANVEFRVFETAIREDMDVTIHEERLQ